MKQLELAYEEGDPVKIISFKGGLSEGSRTKAGELHNKATVDRRERQQEVEITDFRLTILDWRLTVDDRRFRKGATDRSVPLGQRRRGNFEESQIWYQVRAKYSAVSTRNRDLRSSFYGRGSRAVEIICPLPSGT